MHVDQVDQLHECCSPPSGGLRIETRNHAVFTRDLPVIQGMVLVSAVLVFALSFLVDLAYAVADPRIRYH